MKMRMLEALCLSASVLAADAAGAEIVELQSTTGPGGRSSWTVEKKRLAAQPRWNPTEAEPPLSIKEAILAGTAYLVRRDAAAKCIPVTVNINVVPDKRFKGVWYYYIHFMVSTRSNYNHPGEHTVAVVLMDGSVVVPSH
jgi:hypothetical protein